MSTPTLPKKLEDRLAILEYIEKLEKVEKEEVPSLEELVKLKKARASFERLDKTIDADLNRIAGIYIAPTPEDEDY